METNERIRELEAKVAELTAEVEPTRSSRRNMLKLAGAAAVGAGAAVVVKGGTAAAAANADGQPITIGEQNVGTANSGNETVVVYNSNSVTPTTGVAPFNRSTNLFLVRDNLPDGVLLLGGPNQSDFPAAVGGYAYSTVANGVYGFSDRPGSGVVGVSSGGIAGVNGRNTNTTAGIGAGLRGHSANGPQLLLEPTTTTGSPTTGTWAVGSVYADSAGTLWYCVAGGTPGTWKRLTDAAAAGVFHAVEPFRAYDSREPQPSQGSIAVGQNRTLVIKDKRAVAGGAVTTADVVPPGATAITANVTVVNTVLAGFLTVNPGGSTTVNAATINWSQTGQILNNGVTLTIRPSNRDVTVICGGSAGASTDFVIDITGYFA